MEQTSLLDNVKEIIELRKELLKVNVAEKTSTLGSKIAVLILVIFTIVLSLFFLGFGLSSAINIWLETSVWGYLIVGFLFVLMSIAMISFGKGKLRSIMAFQILSSLEDED